MQFSKNPEEHPRATRRASPDGARFLELEASPKYASLKPSITDSRKPTHRSTSPAGLKLNWDGAEGGRTLDLRLAKPALSQLSYSPACRPLESSSPHPLSKVGLGRFELPTSSLSGMRSNQLSYRPQILPRESAGAGLSKLNSSAVGRTIESQK